MDSTNSNLRAGLAAGLLANGIWGLFPLYWHLLGGAASTEILAHRIVWCLVSLAAALALTGRLGACARAVRALASDRRLALTLFAATVFASANWLINIVGANTDRVVELGIGMFITPLATVLPVIPLGLWQLLRLWKRRRSIRASPQWRSPRPGSSS